jgi:hypothetical protein
VTRSRVHVCAMPSNQSFPLVNVEDPRGRASSFSRHLLAMFGGATDGEQLAKRSATASTVAGLVVSVFSGPSLQAVPQLALCVQAGAGCWVYIDGAAYGVNVLHLGTVSGVTGYSWILLVTSLLSYVMINGVSWSQLVSDDDPPARTRSRVFLIIAITIQLVGLAMGGLIMGQVYLSNKDGDAHTYPWGGVSVFLSTLLIACACWGQRLASLPPRDDSSSAYILG